MSLIIGNIYEGKIVNITNFGVFIDIEGKVGLVHISEVSNDYIKDIREYLKDIKEVKVKVLSIDGEGRISLSLRQAINKDLNSSKKSVFKNSREDNSPNFEDILSKYLKDSEEKIQYLRKNHDSGQRGYGKRNFG